jgi:hypothetical protein
MVERRVEVVGAVPDEQTEPGRWDLEGFDLNAAASTFRVEIIEDSISITTQPGHNSPLQGFQVFERSREF